MTEQQQGKGRPTPKRREAEKRRGGPVATPPTNRKEAARQAKARAADQRLTAKAGRQATGPGGRPLLPRDAGPVRKRVRDEVDSRRNVAGLLLPVAVLMIAANPVPQPFVKTLVATMWLTAIIVVTVDTLVLSRLLRRTIAQQFPQETAVSGHILYGLLRSTVIRRLRMPRPVVPRGRKS